MKILAFAGSNSRNSINLKLVRFTLTYFNDHEIELLDLNKFEMPIYSIDREIENGLPQLALNFSEKIKQCDLILISLAENNGAYSAAFKNIFDWLSRIQNRKVWGNKPMFLMATSPGARGGASVLEIAKNRFPVNGGKVLETFSLPGFNENFDDVNGIHNEGILKEFEEKIAKIKYVIGK